MLQDFLQLVEEFVNAIFEAVMIFLEALGIPVYLRPIDL